MIQPTYKWIMPNDRLYMLEDMLFKKQNDDRRGEKKTKRDKTNDEGMQKKIVKTIGIESVNVW